MKKSWIIIFTLLFTGVAWGQSPEEEKKEFVILGKIDGEYKADKVYLAKEGTTGMLMLDSCLVENNRYVFRGQKPEFVENYCIKSGVKDCRSPYAKFYLDADTVRIRSDAYFFAKSQIEGGAENLLMSYHNFLNNFLLDSLKYEFFIHTAIHGEGDEATELEALKQRSELMKQRQQEIVLKLVKNYSDRVYALHLLNTRLKTELPLEEVKKMRNQFSQELSGHPYMLQLNEYIRLANFGVGSDMPDIGGPDVKGKQISLKDFRGKYVLVDFWASWCGPCIKEMPNVVKLYKECKGKKFEILGVSLDSKKEAWTAMIKKQGMKWPQVCDFQAWYSPAAKACNVQAVPSTILVSPEGKVIAVNLRGEQLIQKVKEVLK